MKVVGFTFVRNAVRFDYPLVEAIGSILPFCEKVIVMAGDSDDSTNELLARSFPPEKVEVYHSVWEMTPDASVLAVETNKALALLPPDTDWAFYIQADEVIHEADRPALLEAMQRWKDDPQTDGLLFDYLHFYGSYDYIGDSRRWYRAEVRVFKPHRGIFAYRDAQGFRKGNNQKIAVRHSGARVFHYGWVRHPELQATKSAVWKTPGQSVAVAAFDYSQIDSLQRFKGTHPSIIQPRISRMNWQFEHDISRKSYSLRVRLLQQIERLTGWRIGEFRNYRRI